MVTVELKGVTKNFGKVTAANDVSFEVENGELFFLLGPSGCGKTTILRLVAGFYMPDRGDILFDQTSVVDVPPNKRNTGMVFQNYALWPHMTVYDNIAYGLRIKGIPMNERVDTVKDYLAIVRMEEYASRYPNQLSGGQQQRIALARALAIEPSVLLLDEPLSNLDAKLRLETRVEIKRIQTDLGITSIYVTHDQEEALSMADRIAVVNGGRIEQIGTPRQVYDEPRNRFVAEFIGETNAIEGRVEDVNRETWLMKIKTKHGFDIYSQAFNEVEKEQEVVCLVRPEDIKILGTLPEASCENQFEAIVKEINYYGASEHYKLGVRENLDLRVVVAGTGQGKEIGQGVHAAFQPRVVKVFPI